MTTQIQTSRRIFVSGNCTATTLGDVPDVDLAQSNTSISTMSSRTPPTANQGDALQSLGSRSDFDAPLMPVASGIVIRSAREVLPVYNPPEERDTRQYLWNRTARAGVLAIGTMFPYELALDVGQPPNLAVTSAVPPEVADKDLEVDRPPWRGVFVPAYERQTLFCQTVELRTADLPRWEPHITISRRWTSDDGE